MLVVLGLVVVGVAIAGLVGLGRLVLGRSDEDDTVSGGSGALLVAGGAAMLVVGAALVAVVGVDGGSDNEDESFDRGRPAPMSVPDALGPVIPMAAAPERETFPSSYDGVDGLEPNTVLRLRVDGFEPFAEAVVRQCASGDRCGNPVDVQFGEEGIASIQYLVVDDFAPAARRGRCRPTASPCSIVVTDVDGERRAEIHTVFHDPLGSPGRIRVTPNAGLVDGQPVTVEIEDYPPGAAVRAMLCAAPDATGTERCGSPAPTADMTVGADGTARTRLTIRAGPVGDQRVVCGRDRACGVSVASPTIFARAPVVPIDFAAPSGAHYDPRRLAVGLGAAALMVSVATWLLRRTDWSPIGEEAAPEIDDTPYADLDAIVAALPPEDTSAEMSDTGRRA